MPNDKGAVRAVDARVDEIHTVVSASESHNLANVNMTIAESLTKLGAVAEVARRAGVSKDGIGNRVFRSFCDLLAVRWMKSRHLNYRIRSDEGGTA